MSMQDALLEIAKEHKLSLVFNSQNIPDRQVSLPSKGSSTTQMDVILQGTDLEYRIESSQIYLYIRRNIYGYIEDASSGERLIAATIYIPTSSGYAVANEQGYFSLSTIEDSVSIEVSYLGYETLSKTLGKDQMDEPVVLQLTSDTDLKEVIISDLATTAVDQNYIELNKGTDILLHQNQAVSAIGGEPDIFQAMMRQTGVNAGTDGIGGMHVRGGKNDQNLIMVDGVKLYNSAHAFGAMSIVNSGIIDQARLFKSGASGSRFGRLSSIMDIKTKDPNLKKVKASIQASTIASQASLELPLIKDKLGVMVTGRRTHVDSYIRAKSSESKLSESNQSIGETNYSFNDINIKALAKVNARHRFYLSAYRGQDRYDDFDIIDFVDDFGDEYFYDEQLYYDWQNQFASLRYNLLIGNNTIANIQLSRYQYAYNNFLEWNQESIEFGVAEYYRDYIEFQSGVNHDEAKIDLQTIYNQHDLNYGVAYGQKRYNLGELTYEYFEEELDSSQVVPEADFLKFNAIGNYDTKEYSIYITDKFKVSDSWLIDAGVYFTKYSTISEFFLDDDYAGQDFHGYLKTMYQVNENFSFGSSVGSFLQTEHLLTTSDNGYPNDIWVPSSKLLQPERSNQVEIFANINAGKHQLKISSYIKRQDNILFYDTIRTLPSLTDIDRDYLEEVLASGAAKSYGIEANYAFMIKDKFAINAAYTYSNTDYQFDRINEGKAFPFDYSIPHTLSIGSNIYFSKRLTMSLDWYYATGKPYTLYYSTNTFSPLDRDTEIDNLIEPVTGGYNDDRLPDTHKLSVSLSTYWNWGKARSDLSLGIQNVYNRKNVIYQYELDDVGLQQQLGFALFPMLRWRVGI